MKQMIATLGLLLVSIGAGLAQVQVNPSAGLTLGMPNNMDDNTSHTVKAGWTAGADVRLGHRVYFQPGLYFIQTKTGVVSGENVQYNSDYVRSTLRAKALLGFDPIHRSILKLRLNAGPSYDVLVNVEDGGNPFISKENTRNGALNLNAGIGLDIAFISADIGYWYGLTNAFDEGNTKFSGLTFTLGFVIGRK